MNCPYLIIDRILMATCLLFLPTFLYGLTQDEQLSVRSTLIFRDLSRIAR